jgi:hypothetical protein
MLAKCVEVMPMAAAMAFMRSAMPSCEPPTA